jgi:hypothetical protein
MQENRTIKNIFHIYIPLVFLIFSTLTSLPAALGVER